MLRRALTSVALPLAIAAAGVLLLRGYGAVLAAAVAVPCGHVAALSALSLATKALKRGGGVARQVALWSVMLTLPLYMLLGIETYGAARNHLSYRLQWSDRDFAMARLIAGFPGGHRQVEAGGAGIHLYKPFQSGLYAVNSLGLRTAEPQPKRPGEWRVAVVGGSTVWGYNVADPDTIAARLGEAVASRRPGVTVYNLGVENAKFADELRLVENFADVFQLDQVLFYHGVNDTAAAYNAILRPELANKDDFFVASGGGLAAAIRRTNTFALLDDLLARWLPARIALPPEAEYRRRLDETVTRHTNTLAAARQLCEQRRLACDFFWQPEVADKPEQTYFERDYSAQREGKFPHFAKVARDYGDAVLATAPDIADLRGVFAGRPGPAFIDVVHLNGDANDVVAQALAHDIIAGMAVGGVMTHAP